ncbi:MAG TPA: imidazole glycerol phosphate synthase subunit HisF, partial [Candidatus Atribacteria bacterium]|nr:imidazole glycerol phosphate synthase subunit HisF [Candidatus Atribacteria bacterium]
MLRPRVFPCLLLKDSTLVKTTKFKDPQYIGDPINTVEIYNDMEVDELIFLDITATIENKKPPFEIISQIASECFMPFTYGGGVNNLDYMKHIFKL